MQLAQARSSFFDLVLLHLTIYLQQEPCLGSTSDSVAGISLLGCFMRRQVL